MDKNKSLSKSKESLSQNAVNLFEQVRQKIVLVRGCQVILDSDVAALYGVETKRVNEAVRNNPDKFPNEYMFELDRQELACLRSKNSTANVSPKSRVLPKAFTEKRIIYVGNYIEKQTGCKRNFCNH